MKRIFFSVLFLFFLITLGVFLAHYSIVKAQVANTYLYLNGNVGIGTTSPASQLHITQALQIDGTDTGGFRAIGFGGNSPTANPNIYTNGNYLVANAKNGANGLFLNFDSGNASITSIQANGGNVGIGTTNPQALLDVVGGYVRVGNSKYFSGTSTTGTTMQIAGIDGANNVILGNIGGISTNVNLYAGAAVKMTIGSGGNVGIGTTSPVSLMDVRGTVISGNKTVNNISNGMSGITNGQAFNNYGAMRLRADMGGAVPYAGRQVELVFTGDNGNFGSGGGFSQAMLGAITTESMGSSAETTQSNMSFFTTGGNTLTKQVTINNNGNVGIGEKNPLYTLQVRKSVTNYLASFENTNNTTNALGILVQAGNTGTSGTLIQFIDGGGNTKGAITWSGGTTTYGQPSDVRLKTNIVDTGKGLTDLLHIKVHDFNFKSDVTHKIYTGFVAQELNAVYPDAVAVPTNPADPWMVDYGKVTPLLVKAIQEQQAQIESFKSAVQKQQQIIDKQQVQIDELRKKLEK